jgi:hypothetical protein
MEGGVTVLIEGAIDDDPNKLDTCIKVGAELETRTDDGDIELLAACRAGGLSSVEYLVRQGAKLGCEHKGRTSNVYRAAYGRSNVIEWLLVERWTNQSKLASESTNSRELAQCRFWTGVRTVMIPLRGDFERPKGSSLLDHARYLHSFAKGGWRILVPLGWDTIAHLVPLAGEA